MTAQHQDDEGAVLADAATELFQWLLDTEVQGTMLARATRPIDNGEIVSTADVDAVSEFRLLDEDRDAAHFTLLLHSRGWSLVFDSRFNRTRALAHIGAAEEFAGMARAAFERGALRAFTDNAYSAAELLAKTELLATLEDLLAQVSAITSGDSPPKGFSFYAHREIRRGEVVEIPPGGLMQMLRPPADDEPKPA